MKRKQIGVAVGVLAVGSLFLSACASQAATALPNRIQVENLNKNEENQVSVSAKETVKVVPDMAVLTYGVYTENADAGVCQQMNTQNVNAVIDYLKKQGYEEKSIQTSGFNLEPRYDWNENDRKLIGYEMRTQITLSDVPLDNVGALLSEAVETGANEIQSVSFLSGKYDEAYQEALTKAMEKARAKAEVLAKAGGCEVGEILRVQEYGDSEYGRYVSSNAKMAVMETAAAGAADMGVMPGEMEVSAQLNVEYSLKPATAN